MSKKNNATFIFSEETMMSEPSTTTKLTGFEIEYDKSGKKRLGKQTMYFFPVNSKGTTNPLRWHSMKKEDVARLIEVLQNLIK